MNRHAILRIKLAQKLIQKVVLKNERKFLCAYISSSVATNQATEFSNLNIRVVFKESNQRLKHKTTVEEGIVVEWVYEPREHYETTDKINGGFIEPYNINTGILVYDPTNWLITLKKEIQPNVYNEEILKNRVDKLWGTVQDLYLGIDEINQYDDFMDYFKMLLMPTLLIPIAATATDPCKRTLLQQAKRSFEYLGFSEQSHVFHQLIGCCDITRQEAHYFLESMLQMYDFCIEVQNKDYHGINKEKRNYLLNSYKRMINDGDYQDVMYPILDWMWLIDFRITTDTGDTGWWTDLLKSLEHRLKFSPAYFKEKKVLLIQTMDVIKRELIDVHLISTLKPKPMNMTNEYNIF